jgi:uncharacterized membrane protein
MMSRKAIRNVVVVMVVAAGAGIIGGAAAQAQNVPARSLVFASYNDKDTAADVLKTLVDAQPATGVRIESFAVVSMNEKGKVRVLDQRHTDAGAGAVLGAVVGLLGGPVGVALGAGAGGTVGYLTGDAVGISRENVEAMKSGLTPDTSALAVVLEDRWVSDIARGLEQAKARSVIASRIAPR